MTCARCGESAAVCGVLCDECHDEVYGRITFDELRLVLQRIQVEERRARHHDDAVAMQIGLSLIQAAAANPYFLGTHVICLN